MQDLIASAAQAQTCRNWMKAIIAVVIVLASSSLANVYAVALPERISFRNILENKDITLGEGDSVFQDSQGFMWLGGSNALIRYDGYEFRHIELHENAQPATVKVPAKIARNSRERRVSKESRLKVPVKVAQHFYEDHHKIIWISSRTGVLQYDINTEKLTKLPDDDSQPIKISTTDFKKIIELPTGEILGCSLAGLFVIDRRTLKYTVIVPDPSKLNWLKGKRVNTAHIDKRGVIWLGTDEGLERMDWSRKYFTLYKLDAERPDVIANNRVVDIVEDKNGNFWLATSYGLVHFNTLSYATQRYVNNPKDPYSLSGDDLWKLLIDSQGVLWMGSDGGGVSVFDEANQRFINHKSEAGRLGSLNTNQVRTLYEDNSGDIWVGFFPVGFNYYDRSGAAISSYSRESDNPKSLNYNHVLSVLEGDDGNLWLGTDGGGLNYFNRETGEFKAYKYDPDDPTSINGDSILSTYKDSQGLIWVGFWGRGLGSFDPKDMKFTRYPVGLQRKSSARVSTSKELNSEHVWSIREDKDHNMWITTHTGGLSKYNRATKEFTHYTHVLNDPLSIADGITWNTLEDSSGRLWVGTGSGLSLLDQKNNTFTTFTTDPKNPRSLSNPFVISIFEDSKKRLWLGTDVGLNLFHPETQDFTRYDKKNGLLDDTIRTILEDAQGNLWLSTNNGFSKFNPETSEIKNVNRIDGRLIGGLASRSGIVSSRGEIIYGGVNGLRIIRPNELLENKKIPPIVLTDFKLFSDSVEVGGPDGLLKRSINQTQEIELNYSQSIFAISFAALNFRDTDKNQYSYKLDGFDADWIDAGDQRTAKYTNLDPGKYVFRVKGSNNDGVWNEQGKSITIIQRTPPWMTWWAFSLYVMTGLCFVFWFIYQQRRKRHLVEEHNRMLELKVVERTAEVREKNKDIHVMLSNIPQGIFTVQNDGRVHSEYSQYLESIFETKEIAGRSASDLLFSRANLVGDELALARSAIFAIIGEDEINFELNRALLLDDYDIEIDGRKKYLALDWNPIIEGEIVDRLMISVRDVTQLKQMESNLIQSEKLAALGALVAGVAHELNTPIGNGLTVATTLCDSCDLMKEQMKNGLTKSALEKFVQDMDEGTHLVNRNLERASELVSSFKQVAVDRTSAKRRKFSLQEILNEICLTVSPSFKRTPYVVEIRTHEDINLDSYPGPLGQVITNLLNNAVIHAFDGRDHGRVVVTTKNVLGGVNITVADDGVGITPENQQKIFDPFFTTKLGRGGNGLGMHIVHNIVTGVLGGTIQLHSQVGEGTSFTLFLPKAAPSIPAADDEILS
jgi:signal transduction histidine kinase/ligand-binding sensor domain-containing protein